MDEGKAREAVTAVVGRKPRGYLGTLQHFHRLVKLDIEKRLARVESAVVLGSELQSKIIANLAEHHGAGLNVSFVVNPAVIGGLRIKVGSTVYDSTVATRLQTIVEKL